MLAKICRAIALTLLFVFGATSIYATCLLGYPLKYVSRRLHHAWIAQQKRNFGALLIACTQFFAPSTTMQLHLPPSLLHNGTIKMDHRAVAIANHQLYNDWIYMWWFTYINGVADAPIIMLKESLRKIPVIGGGGAAFDFLFMARKWNVDEARIRRSMTAITRTSDPCWLIMFPEGTVTSVNTVERSTAYAAKLGKPVPRNVLLPRTRGLYACLKDLDGSFKTLYDFTIYYEGVPEGKYGEDVYTLKKMYWDSQPPPTVKIHVREIAVRSIPRDPEQFDAWLYEQWSAKDKIMDDLRTAESAGVDRKVELFSLLDIVRPFYLPLGGSAIWALLRGVLG